MMVGIIICEVITIMCDIGTINVRFHLLKIPYPHQKSVGIVELPKFETSHSENEGKKKY
jgi:hypothetical protein